MKDNTFNEAKQLYLEQYASAIVTGRTHTRKLQTDGHSD